MTGTCLFVVDKSDVQPPHVTYDLPNREPDVQLHVREINDIGHCRFAIVTTGFQSNYRHLER